MDIILQVTYSCGPSISKISLEFLYLHGMQPSFYNFRWITLSTSRCHRASSAAQSIVIRLLFVESEYVNIDSKGATEATSIYFEV